MYGSTDITTFRTTSSPSAGVGTSTSTRSKSVGFGSPTGRAASRISRPFMGVLSSYRSEVGLALVEERGNALGVLRAPPRLRIQGLYVGVLVEPTRERALDQCLPAGQRDARALRQRARERVGAFLNNSRVVQLVHEADAQCLLRVEQVAR